VEGAQSAEAVIDNGEFGVHTIRFETGRLAQQAAGSALVTLDGETVVLSATTASKQPKDIWTSSADGGRGRADVRDRPDSRLVLPPGGPSFRGRDPYLPPDRPPAAPVVRQGPGATRSRSSRPILALGPDTPVRRGGDQRRVMSTQIAGLPFLRPIGGVRVALIKGQWVGFSPRMSSCPGHLRHGGGGPDASGRRKWPS